MTRRVLGFSVAAEAATGVAAFAAPAIVGQLLLGVEISGVASVAVRCFGIALIALCVAAWPGNRPADALTQAVRAMASYNALIALFLGYVGGAWHIQGVLLWPAVALHGVIALLLAKPAQSH